MHHISTQPDVDGASCDISNPNVLECNKGKDSTQSQSAVAKNCTEKKRSKTLVISILLVCYHSSVLETGKTRQSRNVNTLFLVDNVHCVRVGGLLCTADILTKYLVLTCNKCYVFYFNCKYCIAVFTTLGQLRGRNLMMNWWRAVSSSRPVE